jgi:hypothetical protein
VSLADDTVVAVVLADVRTGGEEGDGAGSPVPSLYTLATEVGGEGTVDVAANNGKDNANANANVNGKDNASANANVNSEASLLPAHTTEVEAGVAARTAFDWSAVDGGGSVAPASSEYVTFVCRLHHGFCRVRVSPIGLEWHGALVC